MTDDRDALIDRTADGIEAAFARGLASPQGRAAYADLTRDGGTLTINGREISPETGEVGRDGTDDADGADSDDANPEAGRAAREAGLVWDADPDQPIALPRYEPVGEINGFPVYLPFTESRELARIGEGLIDRFPNRHGAFVTQKITIRYLWAGDLGKLNGEPRLWRLRKSDNWTDWALGSGRPPRVAHLFLLLNSRVANYAKLTNWQAQAAIHEALECVRVRDGKLQINPLLVMTQAYIIRRYGNWHPDMRTIAKAMRLAETDQLPLWEDDEDGDDE